MTDYRRLNIEMVEKLFELDLIKDWPDEFKEAVLACFEPEEICYHKTHQLLKDCDNCKPENDAKECTHENLTLNKRRCYDCGVKVRPSTPKCICNDELGMVEIGPINCPQHGAKNGAEECDNLHEFVWGKESVRICSKCRISAREMADSPN